MARGKIPLSALVSLGMVDVAKSPFWVIRSYRLEGREERSVSVGAIARQAKETRVFWSLLFDFCFWPMEWDYVILMACQAEFENLEAEQRRVMALRLGLDGSDPLTWEWVADNGYCLDARNARGHFNTAKKTLIRLIRIWLATNGIDPDNLQVIPEGAQEAQEAAAR
jgi:hypothetical protein|tara:strand:+ start:224 stop:724 length:501 start_codon:yes stop_codon:yes gene_type:complete